MPEEPYKNQDAPYTNRELREKWHDLANSISTLSIEMSNGFTEVKAKQDTTNGRVKELELKRAEQGGFSKAVSIFGAAAWAICFAFTGWIAFQVIDTGNQIQVINAKLSAYDITVQ